MVTALALRRRVQFKIDKHKRAMDRRKPPRPMSLLKFGLKYFKHYFTCTMPDFHKELIADLEKLKPGESMCRIAPRGSAKSTWTTLIYPIWKTVYRQKKYIIILGDTQPNASKFLDNIKREFEDNEKLKDDFPDCRPSRPWRGQAIELSNGIRIESLCYGKGKIRGRRHGHYRPDLVIIDDPQNAEDSCSPTQLEKDEQWLKSDVLNAGEPNTNYILVGTALVEGCLVLQVKKTLPTWSHKTYRSLISEPANMHLWHKWRELLWDHENPNKLEAAEKWYLKHKGGEGGMDHGATVLWPGRVPLYQLMLKRFSEGERAFASEHQGIPMPPGEAEFGPHLFDWDGFYFDEWPENNLLELYALDPSKGKESKEGDFQAFVRIVVDRYFRIYCECWMEKMNITQLCEFIVDLYRDKPGEAVVVEANGFQELLEIPLKHAAAKYSFELPIFLCNNTTAKPVRIRRLAGPLEVHEVRFKRLSKGTAMLIDQLKHFRHPAAKGQHDDGPDILETAIRIAKKLWNKKAAA